MSTPFIHKLKKSILIVLGVLLLLVVGIPASLYIPAVQDFAKGIALKEVKKSTGMDITVGFLRLKFPLRVQLDDVTVLQADADTLATLGEAKIKVKVLPLLRGSLQADGVDIKDVLYILGTPDSAIYLRADIHNFTLDNASMAFKEGRINVGNAILDGGDVILALRDTVTPEKTDTAAAKPLYIAANNIDIRRLKFRMTMLPTIDSLGTDIDRAILKGGVVDMANHRINAKLLQVDSITATYLTPSAEWLKAHPAKAPADTVAPSTSEPWTITADRLALTSRRLTYAMAGTKPAPGFDMNYIEVSNTTLQVDSFYNRATNIRVPIAQLEATERCGLNLSAAGTFAMDSTMMRANNFVVKIGSSVLNLNANLGTGNIATNPATPVGLLADAKISLFDIERAMPAMRKLLKGMPHSPISLHADATGTIGSLDVNGISLLWPSYLTLKARGHVDNPTNFAKMNGQVALDGNIQNINFLKPTLLGAAMSKQLNLPPSTIKGNITYRPNLVKGDVALRSGHGDVLLKGDWNGRATNYDATLSAAAFPVNTFLPSLGVGPVTAKVKLKGHGYNPLLHSTSIDADVQLASITYQGTHYKDIDLAATLSGGNADGHLRSHNPGADLDADFNATLSTTNCEWDVNGDIRELDLVKLGLSKEPLSGSMAFSTIGTYSPKTQNIDAEFVLTGANIITGTDQIIFDKLTADFSTADTLTHINLTTGDLNLLADAYCGLTPLTSKIQPLTTFINSQIQHKQLDVEKLQSLLPQFDMHLTSGANNAAAQYLASSGIQFSQADIIAHNDSLIQLNANITGLVKDKFRLDDIAFNANQHGKFLVYSLRVDNRPGTLDDFAHVKINGFAANDKLTILVNQHNIKDEQGFYFGFAATVTDTLANVKMVPFKPVIAYQQWEVNPDNDITFNFIDKHLDANLALHNDKSYLKIFTEHDPNEHIDSLTHHREQEDVIVQISDIQLADWLSISPFAPPIKGALGADMRFRWANDQITGRGTVSLNDLYYGRDRVGTFDLDLNVANSKNGALHADVALLVDSVKVITATGALNDSTLSNPFLLDFSMIRFPLQVANPFLPKEVAQLKGTLNGNMKITGTMNEPIFNGYLDFDSSAVNIGITGASYPFSSQKIPVDSNIVRFNNFYIGGLNKQNLTINGTVNARHISNIGIDLGMKASNMQIVNSSRPRGASLYGKAFIDLDATARGNLTFLDVNANLNILPETNVTYVMTPAQSTLKSKNTGDMVQFVQFNDTTSTNTEATKQPTPFAINLDAALTISEGSTINVDISSDGKNRAQVQGMGQLTYSLDPMNSGRLTGRFTINNGFVRYTPQIQTGDVAVSIMSEKNFRFEEGSYVAFNGDMLNPTLNIHAIDEMKANVTQEGQNSRLVNFLVGLNATGTLQNINAAFTLSTNDDITIQNELQSMSPEQRANQAMNLLLYNVYTGPGTKGNANISGNPLFSFLESQLNTWAANNIRGVDISFGIDQYDKTTNGTSQTTTSYSYRVSKTLFNNKFKIVIGGNYSTDANADENLEQNLINDIAFEYMLNRSGSMYVRLFRHVGYESILEGEVVQTGVGFVYRHKINSLLDLFHWKRYKKQQSK